MENAKIDSGHSRLTRSAGVVSIAVMGSRVLGLVREIVLAHFFEAKTSLDAYDAAFRIPNFLRDLFGEGVLSKAFVTTFTGVETRSGENAAWRLANLVFNALTIILTIITLIAIILAPLIVSFIFMGKGFDTVLPPESSFGFADKRELTVYLARIMFPFLLLVSLAAISMGLLNSKGRFGVPASASSFFNLGSVIVGVWGYYTAPKLGQHPTVGMAVGVLVGGALQFVMQMPSMWRVGFRYRPILSFTDPDLKQVMKLVAPAILGTAALQVNLLTNSFFASQGEGWMAWNIRAFRIMHFPIGVLGVAISTASLPVLSRFAAQDSMDEYRRTFSYALKLVFILALPASAGLMVLSRPIISLLYEHGKFGADDTVRAAGALFCYAFGLCGYSGVKIATDGFYALKNIRTPVVVSLFTIAFNILLNYVFIFQLGFDHRSLAISTACSITTNFLLVLGLLWRRVRNFGGRDLASVFAKSVIGAAGMGAVVVLAHRWLLSFVGSKLSLMAAIIVAMPVFYGLSRVLRLREIDQVIGAIVEKIRR
jgi:putative peptidoglycan lipid II flippase